MSRVILWDFDGTLGWRDGAWSGALHEVLLAYDPVSRVTADDLRPHLQWGFPWLNPENSHLHLNTSDAWWSHLEPVFAQAYERCGLTHTEAKILASCVRTQYLNDPGWHLFDDVIPALSVLCEAGWRHMILSNHVPELRSIVSRLGLDAWVTDVLSSAEIGYEKPHSEAFRQALNRAGQPERVWMVGDNYTADVLGAEQNGVRAILVRRPDTRATRFATKLMEVASFIQADAGIQRLADV